MRHQLNWIESRTTNAKVGGSSPSWRAKNRLTNSVRRFSFYRDGASRNNIRFSPNVSKFSRSPQKQIHHFPRCFYISQKQSQHSTKCFYFLRFSVETTIQNQQMFLFQAMIFRNICRIGSDVSIAQLCHHITDAVTAIARLYFLWATAVGKSQAAGTCGIPGGRISDLSIRLVHSMCCQVSQHVTPAEQNRQVLNSQPLRCLF